MVSLILDFALFLLVLLVGLPTLMVVAMLLRENFRHHGKLSDWHKEDTGKSAIS